MKKYEFSIYKTQEDFFFTPIRGHNSYVLLLAEVLNLISVGDSLPIEKSRAKLVIEVEKMSRVHLISDKKYFSVNFPFSIIESDRLEIYSPSVGLINDVTISFIRSVFRDSGYLENDCIADFAGNILDHDFFSNSWWPLIKELLSLESGYIRYDHDPERANGRLHPLHHLDIFSGSKSTFKLGLNGYISESEFSDMLNLKTDCRFIT